MKGTLAMVVNIHGCKIFNPNKQTCSALVEDIAEISVERQQIRFLVRNNGQKQHVELLKVSFKSLLRGDIC